MTKHEIPDREILDWIESGQLRLTNVATSPRIYFRGRELKAELMYQRGRMRIAETGHRYRVQFKHTGRRRKIQRSRLVWMYAHRELIGDDELIHHGKGGKYDDSIGNLSKVSSAEHLAIHYDLPEY